MEFKREGVSIQPIFQPRLHAKTLAWDDDALAVSSQNWLSASSSNDVRREIGIFIDLQGLSAILLETVEMFKDWGTTPLLETALRWYASGVRSSVMEDQFQLFWFVIEIIGASVTSAKVADKCVRCGGSCAAVPVVRFRSTDRFPQKISAMLSQGGVQPLLIEDLFYVRNALLHGTPREEIEKRMRERDPSFSFDKIVDFAGRTAWHLILHTFKKPPGEHRPNFLQVNTYVDWQLSAKAHVQIGIPGHALTSFVTHMRARELFLNSQCRREAARPARAAWAVQRLLAAAATLSGTGSASPRPDRTSWLGGRLIRASRQR